MRFLTTTIIILLQASLVFSFEKNINFSYLTKDNGLSDSNVECIIKDQDGFMWFGTRNGLCKYDGYEITVFRKGSTNNSISGNRILDITEDYEGLIWIGTMKNGLCNYNKQTNQFTKFDIEVIEGPRINQVKVFKDSTIWVCSNHGLYNINKKTGKIEAYFQDESNGGLNSSVIYDIIETASGEIYVATEGWYIQKYDKQKKRFSTIEYKRNQNFFSNYRKRIIEDKNGVLWISASNHGLASYNPKTNTSKLYLAQDNHLSTNRLMGDMDIAPNGEIWICTEDEGLNIFNPETESYQTLKRNKYVNGALNTNHIYTIYIDDENIVWVGTFDNGVNIFNPNQKKFNYSVFSPKDLNILNNFSVLDILEDSKGRIWMGTDGNGLFRFEKNKAPIHYNKDDASGSDILISNVITSLGEDPNGNILIGNYSGGLSVLNPTSGFTKKFFESKVENELGSPHVWDLITDSKDRVWLGLLVSGVAQYLYNDNIFVDYGPFSNQTNKIDFFNVMTIFEDSDGDLWFGTEGKGLYILDGQTNRIIRTEIDTVSKFSTEGVIKCIEQDQWENIWIGTEDYGLFKYNKKDKEFIQYSYKNGFISSPVQSLVEDVNGNIWIGTTQGLYMHNTNDQTFTNFVIDDGLSSNDINPDAMTRLSDGRILVGTNRGADIIPAQQIKLNDIVPKVLFTKLSVLNQEITPNTIVNDRQILEKNISYTKEIELLWSEKTFTVEFAAINYTLPEKCIYKYKLEGFDNEWIYTPSKMRIAKYSNLNPGTYTLRVQASNNDGKWGDNEINLSIIIKPPFWKTFVFKVLLLAIFAGIVYIIYRNRINMHKERFRQQQLEADKRIMALENENLEAELKKLAFSIHSKNKLLLEQKNRIISLMNKAKVSVKEGLQKMIDKIDEDMDEGKDWSTIEPQIDKAYNQFITKLRQKHPDLSANEIRIAAYIRMNLSTKEICEFMNKTQRAIENDRYRLRKKIGLATNDSIQNYFLNI